MKIQRESKCIAALSISVKQFKMAFFVFFLFVVELISPSISSFT